MTHDLRAAYDELVAEPFPRPGEVPAHLVDWFLDLAETDGYYAGLAQRVLAGEDVRLDKRAVAELPQELTRAQAGAPDEAAAIARAERYLELLERVVDASQI